MLKILAVGDPHAKPSAITEIKLLKTEILKVINTENPDFVVILGDLQDKHANMDVFTWEVIRDFMTSIADLKPVYYIIGNHDIGNQGEIHSKHHWFNTFKNHNRIKIIDGFQECEFLGHKFLGCAYLPPGEFVKMYNDKKPTNIELCFVHQEFLGASFGAINSTKGDEWPLNYPLVVSGHVHERSWHQKNILYVGSSRYTNFSEITSRSLSLIQIDDTGVSERPIHLSLPRKHTFHTKVSEVINYIEILESGKAHDEIRLIVQDSENSIALWKKTKEYSKLIKTPGIKVVLKPVVEIITKNKKMLSFSETLIQYIKESRPSASPLLEELLLENKG
jgi:DNA repair exonuclease SbcCD nuclease subunit